MDPDEMHPQTREKFCETHGVFMVKNAVGDFVCLFCEFVEANS